jgi:hypothetical protein
MSATKARERVVQFGLAAGDEIVAFTKFRTGAAVGYETASGRRFRVDPHTRGVVIVEVTAKKGSKKR